MSRTEGRSSDRELPSARPLLSRLALAAVSLACALLAAELALRWLAPDESALAEVSGERWPEGTTPSTELFIEDPELGYRPRLGTSLYNPLGALVNGYPESPTPGVERLAFLGDSATFRGGIVRALEGACAEAPAEYWNLGVEGYNTSQEVAYYLRWGRAVAPDHLILTFHNNDFFATPVALAGPDGEFTVIVPQRRVEGWHPEWIRASRLYRAWFRWRLRHLPAWDLEEAREATTAALRSLEVAVEEDGARLSVVLLPILAPYGEWTEQERASRDLAREIFDDLGLDWYDLFDTAEAASRAGIDLAAQPGDRWHPSAEAADLFAGSLLDEGLLEGPTWASCRPPPRWRRLERRPIEPRPETPGQRGNR